MTELNIFEQFSRAKGRFQTPRGELTDQDLWDLPFTSKSGISLESIGNGLAAEIRNSAQVSFIDEVSKTDAMLELKLQLVKHVYRTRKDEGTQKAQALAEASAREEQRQLLRASINGEKNAKLIEGTLEDRQARLTALGG